MINQIVEYFTWHNLRVGTKYESVAQECIMYVHTQTQEYVRLLLLLAENKMKKWCHCLPNMRLLLLSDGVSGDTIFVCHILFLHGTNTIQYTIYHIN